MHVKRDVQIRLITVSPLGLNLAVPGFGKIAAKEAFIGVALGAAAAMACSERALIIAGACAVSVCRCELSGN